MSVLLATLVSSSALAAEPAAPGVLVWMEAAAPADDVAARADRLTGGASPYTWGDFAFARGEETEADRARLLGVSTAVEAARKKWLEFDVELGIARQIDAAVDAVELLPSEADRDAVVAASLLSGLAVHRAIPESRFATAEEAAPFRAMIAARAAPAAWLRALALAPDRVWTRAEVDDAAGLAALLALREELRALPPATLVLPERPAGVVLVVDGAPVPEGATELALLPGRHYLHVRAGDRVAGRARVELVSGQRADFPIVVDAPTLAEARERVLAGDPVLPEPVMEAVAPLRTVGGAPARLFFGALDERGRPELLAVAGGATLARPKPFTALLAGDLGGGVIRSSAFEKEGGAEAVAPTFGPHLGLQLGVYNFVVLGGASAYVTPSQRVTWAQGDTDAEDVAAPVLARPYVGVGAYLPQPTDGKLLLQLSGTYGWLLPGSSGFGGSFALGLPTRQESTWFRVSVDGHVGVQGPGEVAEGTPTWVGIARIGFARKL